MNEQALRDAIVERRARVVIIGCGYVGLPLCVAFAKAGFPVTAIEIDQRRVEQIRQGVSYIRDVESRDIDEHTKSGRLSATTEYDAVADADVIVVAVPTPYDRAKQPDLSAIVAAAEGIAARLRSGQLVILESTTYPGTTDEVMRPTLERSGLRSGRDFWLAFSPERIDPGNRTYLIENTPKVVGGVDPASTKLAAVFLEQIVTVAKVHP